MQIGLLLSILYLLPLTNAICNLPMVIESGSERKRLRLLRGKRANGEHYYSLWMEDSPQFTAEMFNNKKMGLDYLLIRSKKRKKTISLHVKEDGTTVVYAPYRTPIGEIDKFFNEKKGWLWRKIKEREKRLKEIKPKEYLTGELFLYLGRTYQLKIDDKNEGCASLTFSAGEFVLSRDKVHQGRALFLEWYKKRSREYIEEIVNNYSDVLGLNPGGLRMSNALCRWGSCSSNNNLSFSWRLIMAPCSVICYVVVHELTHMKEKNHSVRFWSLVAKTIPDYKKQRLWLKENGHLLTAL